MTQIAETDPVATPPVECNIRFLKGADYATLRRPSGAEDTNSEKATISKIQESLTEAVNAKNVSFLLGSGCSSFMKNGEQMGIPTMKPLAQEFTSTRGDTDEKKTIFLTTEEKTSLNDSCGLNVQSEPYNANLEALMEVLYPTPAKHASSLASPYTPGYTAKGKKQYRYYISQNLIQMRDHPDGLLGRLPAHEIEATVESVLRHSLCSRSSVVELLGICLDRKIESVQKIVEGQALLQMSRFVQGIIQHITVRAESLEIEVNVQELCTLLSQATETKINSSKETAIIVGAYNTRRAKKGALVIEPEKPDRDIFDLPPDQLKKLVQGFVWRNEHFQGLTIRQIAEREGLSDSHVGKQIFATFELGQMAA